jgi:hypothetical protein
MPQLRLSIMPKYESPMNLQDEHMRLVGIIAAHWEYCDALIQRALREIMSLDSEARVELLTQNISLEKKFDLISIHVYALLEAIRKDPESPLNAKAIEKSYTSTIEDIRSVNKLRNTFVHAGWLFNDETKEMERHSVTTTKKHLDVTSDPVPTSELESAAQQIYAAGAKLVDFFQPFGFLRS